MADIATLLIVLLAALVYALSGYFKSAGQDFDIVKIITTMVIGLVYGIYALYMNVIPTEPDFLLFLGSAGFLVVIVENVVKGIMRRFFGYPEFLK